MITYDVHCDICNNSRCFGLKSKKREMHLAFHYISKKDICRNCAAKILGEDEPIVRDLTSKERKVISKYLKELDGRFN